MASKVFCNLPSHNNKPEEFKRKNKLSATWIPKNILIIYPSEFEDYFDMNVEDVIDSAIKYAVTGEFDEIPILRETICAEEALQYAEYEDYIKFRLTHTEVIRLEEDAFWVMNRIPTGEIALITQPSQGSYSASIFTEHYLFRVDTDDYNNDDDTDYDSTTDNNNKDNVDDEISTVEEMDFYYNQYDADDYETEYNSDQTDVDDY